MRWLGRAACVNSGPPSIAFSRLLKKYSTMKTSYGRKRHAWRRSSTEYMCSVICRRRRGCGRIIRYGSSGPGGRSLDPIVPAVRQHVRQDGASVDSAGETVAGTAAANAVFDPQRAVVDGGDGLQPAVPWFVGLNTDDEVWEATTFTKNRDRLLEADVAKEFLACVVEQAGKKGLTSDEHFTVDGTLLEAWASQKSFQPKQGSGFASAR